MSDPDRRRLLSQEASGLSEASTAIASPTFQQRHTYHRMSSQGSADFTNDPPPSFSNNNMESDVGLGILGTVRSINRVPVGSRNSTSTTPSSPSKPFTPSESARNSPMSPQTPGSSKAFLSPALAWQRYDPAGGRSYGGGLNPMHETNEQDISRGRTHFNEGDDNGYPEDLRPRSMNNEDNDNNRRSSRNLV
jgi:hypothetical protein